MITQCQSCGSKNLTATVPYDANYYLKEDEWVFGSYEILEHIAYIVCGDCHLEWEASSLDIDEEGQ